MQSMIIFLRLKYPHPAPPAVEKREQDIIQKTLNAIGVTYSHHNDEILVPSRIEEERTKKVLVCLDMLYRTAVSSESYVEDPS